MKKNLFILLVSIFVFSNVSIAQTNLALQATASASASSSGLYGPINWNDGQIGVTSNFGWLGTDPANFPTPAWLKYEWSSPKTISKVRFYNPTHTQGNFVVFNGTADLQYKNGSVWTTIAIVSGQNSTYYDVDFSPITTTEIRLTNFNITGLHNPGWDEIEVYNAQVGSDDIGVYELMMPDTINSMQHAIVKVKIVNYGMTNTDSFNICYMRTPTNIKCKTFYKSDFGIPPSSVWDTLLINIDTTNLPLGTFGITAWSDLSSDMDNSNDTAYKTIFGGITTVTDDVGVQEILMPDTLYVSDPSIVDVKLVNYKMTNVDSFDICYIRNFQTPVCMTFYKADYGIPASTIWDTIIVNLDTNYTPIGNFRYVAWTELSTDINNINDTAFKHLFGKPVSIEEYDDFQNSISIYPQPANDLITIAGNLIGSEIQIFDLNGKLIRKINGIKESELIIDISELNTNIYILQIRKNDDVCFKKISIIK